MAKLPCDKVSVAKLLWRSYHVAKLLATELEMEDDKSSNPACGSQIDIPFSRPEGLVMKLNKQIKTIIKSASYIKTKI